MPPRANHPSLSFKLPPTTTPHHSHLQYRIRAFLLLNFVSIQQEKDDFPARYSHIEHCRHLQVAGFVGDGIPTVDPLDSDVEWCEMPTMRDLPTMRTLSQFAGKDAKSTLFCRGTEEYDEEELKGYTSPRPQSPIFHFFLWLCVLLLGWS